MPQPAPNPPVSPEFRAAGSLVCALLLAFTGGALDAFIYLNHGHVFAAAMTGNGVLLGIAVLHHDTAQALRHTLPILAFIVGAFCARLLAGWLKHHAVTVGLLCEITLLFVASWLPGGFPDLVFVPLIAVVAAYQVTSFRTAEKYSYNSTFMTGNLRSAVDGLYDALHPATHDAGIRQLRDFALLIVSFLAGAVSGALLAPHFFNHTLWFIDLPLLAVLFYVVTHAVQSPASGEMARL